MSDASTANTVAKDKQSLTLFAFGVGLYALLHFGVLMFLVPVVEKIARDLPAVPALAKLVIAYSGVTRRWFIPAMVVGVFVLPALIILLARKVSARATRRLLDGAFMLITALNLLVGIGVAVVFF